MFWPKLDLIHVTDPLGLLWGAFGPCLGHCAPKIAKTVTYLISKLDLVQNRAFPPTAQPNFWSVPPLGPIELEKRKFGCAVGGHAKPHESLPCGANPLSCGDISFHVKSRLLHVSPPWAWVFHGKRSVLFHGKHSFLSREGSREENFSFT